MLIAEYRLRQGESFVIILEKVMYMAKKRDKSRIFFTNC